MKLFAKRTVKKLNNDNIFNPRKTFFTHGILVQVHRRNPEVILLSAEIHVEV